MKSTILTIVTSLALCATAVLAEDAEYLSSSSKINFEAAPSAVQNTIKAEAGSAKIEDMEKGTLNGQTVYEAAFKHNGQHTELRVSEDGTVVDRIVAGKSTGAGESSAVAATQAESGNDGGFSQSLSSASKIQFQQVPEHLKRLVKERAGAAKIEDVDKGKLNGGTAYQVAYKKNGKHTELRMTQSGKFAREVTEGKTVYLHQSTTLAESPDNIKKAVRSKIGQTKITTALKGHDGQGQFYRFFYDKNGQDTELRVRNNGESVRELAVSNPIIQESAGAEK